MTPLTFSPYCAFRGIELWWVACHTTVFTLEAWSNQHFHYIIPPRGLKLGWWACHAKVFTPINCTSIEISMLPTDIIHEPQPHRWLACHHLHPWMTTVLAFSPYHASRGDWTLVGGMPCHHLHLWTTTTLVFLFPIWCPTLFWSCVDINKIISSY